jgi:DNA-binding NarL/FixJ family response regulator
VPIEVVVATDSFLLGDGLASMLADVPEVLVVGRARDHYHLLRLVDELHPDAVIYGIRTSIITTMATISVARHLRLEYPAMGFVVISDRANGFATELLRGGASRVAYLLDHHLPSIEAVIASLRAVQVGESVLDPTIVDSLVSRKAARAIDQLTPREHDVLEQMASGLSNAGIASELGLSVKSIEKSVTAIFHKLGPFDPKVIDRRVSSCLEYLRAQANPFGRDELVASTGGPDEGTVPE